MAWQNGKLGTKAASCMVPGDGADAGRIAPPESRESDAVTK